MVAAEGKAVTVGVGMCVAMDVGVEGGVVGATEGVRVKGSIVPGSVNNGVTVKSFVAVWVFAGVFVCARGATFGVQRISPGMR